MSFHPATIDCGTPVNWRHPLNRGLAAWWLAVPGLAGGALWHDLRGYSPGVLTNFVAPAGWQGTFRPGGFGSVLFDGTDDHVVADSQRLQRVFDFGAGTGFLVSAWVRLTASGTYQAFAAGSSSSVTPFLTLAVASGKVRFQYRTDNGSELGSGVYDSTASVNDGRWRHVAIGRNGTTFTVYIDGAVDKTGTSALSFDTCTCDRHTLGALRRTSTPSQYLSGSMDDVRVYSRAVPDAEVRDICESSRRYYPGVLRRVRPRAGVSAGIVPWWASRGGVLGAGVM